MEKIIHLCGRTGSSQIIVNGSVRQLPTAGEAAKTVIVTDENVHRYHHRRFPPAAEVIILRTGETVKNLKTVESIYKRLLGCGADRSSFIIGIGGGVVCDITGFAASTFMRGLEFGFIPTTLLAQVDAAIGGKNGVNLSGFKNMVGVIRQPCFVLNDFSLLKTLPRKERMIGFSEIIKSALIASRELFEFLETNWAKAIEFERDCLGRIIGETVEIKTAIVRKDEQDKKERKKLNLGHTLAHAFEKSYGLTHGEAVSIGMVNASGISVRRGMMAESEAVRIRQLLQKFRLPVGIGLDPKRILRAVRTDKKREGPMIDFILLKSIGEAFIQRMPFADLEEAIHDLCESRHF
ncbi:MAG: 3-dehydroquinate synthase [Candidatus Aminicenantales bacterium]